MRTRLGHACRRPSKQHSQWHARSGLVTVTLLHFWFLPGSYMATATSPTHSNFFSLCALWAACAVAPTTAAAPWAAPGHSSSPSLSHDPPSSLSAISCEAEATTTLSMLAALAATEHPPPQHAYGSTGLLGAAQDLARQLLTVEALPGLLRGEACATFRSRPARRFHGRRTKVRTDSAAQSSRAPSAQGHGTRGREPADASIANSTHFFTPISPLSPTGWRRMQSPPVAGAAAPCPSPPVQLLAPVGKRAAVNYTGGYVDNTNCGWQLRCGGGSSGGGGGQPNGADHVLLLNFTTMDTGACKDGACDYVSLLGVGSDAHDRGFHLSGRGVGTLPSSQFAALTGNLTITLHSDSSIHHGGFAAEYWCAPASTLNGMGCPVKAALNYDPEAFYSGERSLRACRCALQDADPATCLCNSTFRLHPSGTRCVRKADARGVVSSRSHRFEFPRQLQPSVAGSKGAPCPSPPAALTAPAAGAAAVLDDTGGYADDAHCGWLLRCAHDGAQRQVLLLNFTAFDTAATHDYVSLFGGGSTAAPAVARLSGRGLQQLPWRRFGAAGGEMLVTFSSDPSTHYDGFAAEYWCAPAGSVRLGCTDRTASNYDPTARFQDEINCVLDKERQKAALLGAFVGHEAWSGISGWTNGSGDPCAAGAAWEGLTCDGQGRVTRIDLTSETGVRGELYGPALAELAQLEVLCAPVNPCLPLRLGFAI